MYFYSVQYILFYKKKIEKNCLRQYYNNNNKDG